VPLSELRINLPAASAFVLANANLVERAMLEAIVVTSTATRDVTRHLEGLQNPGGGFCAGFEAGQASTLPATLKALGQLRALPPLSGSPMATRALSYIRRNQGLDGAWEGETDLTALSAFILITLDSSHLDPVSRADLWLRKRFDEAGHQPLSSLTIGMTSALWYRLHGAQSPRVVATYDQIAQRSMQSFDLAVWLLAALEVGVGGRYLRPLVEMITRLGGLQHSDGSWTSEGASTVETTLQALRVFRGYDLLESHGGASS